MAVQPLYPYHQGETEFTVHNIIILIFDMVLCVGVQLLIAKVFSPVTKIRVPEMLNQSAPRAYGDVPEFLVQTEK